MTRVTINCADYVPLISFNTVLKMDSYALSISSLFLFHFHIYSHIHIPIQSTITKKNKKVIYSGVFNWVSKIVNYFSGFEPRKKKKEYPNLHKPVPIRDTRGLAGWPFTMWVADLNFQTRSLRDGLWKTCKSGPPPPLTIAFIIFPYIN